MIQRKQTLFLFLSALLGLVLLFVSNQSLVTATGPVEVYLTPLQAPFVSTPIHFVAIALNFITLLLSFITVFLYKRRELQVKLCYVLMLFWIALALLMSFGSFAVIAEPVLGVQKNYTALLIVVFALLANFFAARFTKKDIALLKSADRIR